MVTFTDVKAVANAFDSPGRGVEDAPFGSNTVSDTNTARGALLAFGRDQTAVDDVRVCLLYTSPSPRDQRGSRMPSSA